MAPSTGWRLKYSICSLSIVSVLLTFVPYTDCMRIGMPMHRFCVPHDTNPGYIVTKVLPDPRCLEMNHISQSSEKVANPFHIQDNGYLVTNSSLSDRFQDIYIVKTSPKCGNMPISPVSDSSQIHIEIVGVGGSLTFVHDKYVGTVFKDAKTGTLVEGLSDLFACERHQCGDDVRYSLQGSGSSRFYLRTVDHDGQQSVQILSNGSLQNVREETLNFIISAQNAAGLEGHTNLEINIKESGLSSEVLSTDLIQQDQNLRFQHHRQKRQTPEVRPTQTFPETKTGLLFSVDTPPNPLWEYSLKSSTLENMFQVSTNGQVSLATEAQFDYEDPNKRTATLVITASQNNIDVKDIQFEISITDVNDEDPQFTNQPYPYLAVARNTDSLIYTLTAMDPDAGADLELQGDLTPDLQNLFTVTFVRPNKAEIRTTSNRLTADQEYTLRVIAKDNNAPGISTQRSIAEVLVKAGDRAPQFEKQSYTVSFQEDNNVDQVVTTEPFSATSFQGNAITLSVLDTPSSTQSSNDFGVRPDRNLFAKRKMDYETAQDREFSLTLRATESGTNYVTDVPLTVRVTDLNEEPPKFPLSSYEITFPENVAVGTTLLQVSASDPDHNQRLSFSVDDYHFRADNVVQTADGATAVIRVNQDLDFDRILLKMYDFNVTAIDDGAVPQPKSGSTVVRIVVTNVNDEYPQFPVNESAGIFMTANIRYDLEVGEIVYTLQASDADIGDKVTYQLSPANQFNNLFNLNGQEGSITLARKIADRQDQITDFKYELRVVATDDGGCCGKVNTNPTTGTVTINILTDNDMRPKFDTCQSYAPSVNENSADTFVIKVHARDDDYGSNGEVTYSIRPNQGSDNFRINATTGDVYTAKKINREALVGTTSIAINIDATDGGGSQGTCPLLVTINDVNDNEPVFTSDQYSFNVKNDLDVGSQAFQVQATDSDIGQNADVIYSFISNPDGYFKFDEQTRLTGSVRVNRTLPQEEKTITLEIQAKDNGTLVQLNSTVMVVVRFVENQNQLPPQWQGSNIDYTRRYSESVAVPTDLVPLRAVSQLDDKQLSFYIVGDASLQELFEISYGSIEGDVSTGTLKNKKSLDYETTTSYQISVRASDTGTGYADQIVTIILEDANDNSPEFLGTNSRNWLELQLNEGNYSQVPSPGELVAQLRATDLDRTSPYNQIQEFRIRNSDGTFTLDPTTGILYTRSTFDRESVPKDIPLVKSFIVEAIDAAPSSNPNANGSHNTGQATVKVTIRDVNDNAPVFGQDSYTFRVKEDKLPGTTVATLTAVDPDSDAILEYRRTPTTPFSIQQTTGAIQVQGQLDFDEGIKEYSFRVIVSDQVHEGTASVTIILEDVNDNPPQINGYTFVNFVENSTDPVGIIQRVNASDIDNGGINTFYYSLKFTDELTSRYFAINQNTGDLSITQPLDRDYPNGKAEFTFTIEVADAPEGQNPLYGRNTVIVRPIDVNDNVPFFPADKAQMSVLENQTAVVQVGRVVVTDYDAGVNAEVDLSILSQGPGDNFRLNNSFIYTTQVLDREVEDTYYIIMQAVDKGTPRLTGTGTLTITVRDINDNAPYFLKDLYEFTMSERQKDGPVGTIHANDSDTGQNAALTYSLDVNDRNYFAMSSVDNQGRLTIFAAVDYDDITARQRSFNLTAYAQDSNPGVNFENRAQTSIHVIVTDYNDEIPIFDEPQIRREEYENFTIGDAIATFRATDKDVNPQYSQFEYYIEQKSDPLRLFAIDQNGVVTLRHSLDRETTPFHTIHILAIDNPRNMPQNTGTATLLLTVLDNNDNAPDFSQAYKPSIMENQDYVATEVQKFTAKDADEDKNGPPFTFELVCAQSPSSQCSDFSLSFQQSLDNGNGEGTISVTGRFDREYEDVISLPIRMCDRHNLCAIRYMDVKINDENDNPHDAGYQFILVNNYKGLFGDIPIGEVNVEDPDATNDDKTYELITPEAAVFVEVAPRTGIITLKPKVPEMIFSFGVRVSNQTGRVTESKVTVQVQFISEDAVYSSGSIKIDGITDKDFLLRPKKDGATSLDDNAYHESMYEKFRKLLADKLDTDIKNVFVHGVMSDPTKAEDSVTVFYSAHGSPWYQSSKMSGIVSSNKNDFQAILGNDGTIDMVPVDMCQQEDCEGGCYNDLVVTDTPRLINTHGTSFVGVNSEIKEQCGCRATTFPTNIDCTPGYCYHGGTCVKDKWNVISCECPDRFEGPRCQQLRHSFNGTGYALYKQLEQCENSRTSIEILTNKANSLILYNGPVEALGQTDQSDFILLELVNGRPRLRINHGTGELTLTIPGSKQLNDGTWHRIDIHRKKKEVRLVIDQGQDAEFDSEGNEDRSKVEATGVTPGENIYINADTLLHLGGGSWTSTLPYPSNVMSERFDGCMKNLIHNAELYDLSTGDAFPGSSDGCSREDDACGISCGNGQCLITGVQKQMCDCDPGYRTSSVQTSGSAVTCNTETTKRDFKDESYMDWALKAGFKSMLNSRRTAISFHYRSRDTDGLLFSVVDETQSSKYIKLKLLGGLLEAVYNLGDGPVRVSLSNVPADDGQWHQITVARVGKELTLKMDSGEGRYYAEFQGPENGNLDLSVRQTEIHSGANLFYSSGQPSIFVGNEEDLTSSCINDIRLDRYWFPMKDGEEEEQSFAATIGAIVNTDEGCVRQDCLGKCQQPFICIPLWETYVCDCPDYYIRNANAGCSLKDYCEDDPCVGDASCENLNPCKTNSAECSSPFNKTKRYFECTCSGRWDGDLCQCHPNLGSAGEACEVPPEPPVVAAANVGLIVGILAAVVFLIVMILVIAFLIWRCYKEPEEKEPFDDDPDDIRENIMYYDEEGAGEEDQTGYDLSRLRKPDDGEHVRPWDAPDIPKPRPVKPLGTTSDRPDIGDFINNRLDDADGDPNSPPYDTPVEFDYEGGNSSVGSLSSLNTSSSGDQDYDYLNEWGPKFAKLADMYNNYDETE